jgi:hypothetical protein
MTTETTVVETVTKTPSKVALLKSKITREGLILGGIVAGIVIAGGLTILKSPTVIEGESEDLGEVETGTDTQSES